MFYLGLWSPTHTPTPIFRKIQNPKESPFSSSNVHAPIIRSSDDWIHVPSFLPWSYHAAIFHHFIFSRPLLWNFFHLQLHRLFQPGPCLLIKSMITITIIIIIPLILSIWSTILRPISDEGKSGVHGLGGIGLESNRADSLDCRNPQIWARNPPLLQAPLSFVLHFCMCVFVF